MIWHNMHLIQINFFRKSKLLLILRPKFMMEFAQIFSMWIPETVIHVREPKIIWEAE